MVCLLAVPWVQLSVSAGSGWSHNALRHHWLMPISCHFRDCKALLVTSLTHVSGTISSVQTFTFIMTFYFYDIHFIFSFLYELEGAIAPSTLPLKPLTTAFLWIGVGSRGTRHIHVRLKLINYSKCLLLFRTRQVSTAATGLWRLLSVRVTSQLWVSRRCGWKDNSWVYTFPELHSLTIKKNKIRFGFGF